MVYLAGAGLFLLKMTRYAILFWGQATFGDRLGSGMAEAGILSSMFELAGPVSIL